MIRSTRFESIQEPIDDEERELMDPDTWDWDSAEEFPGGGRVSFEIPLLFTGEQYGQLVDLAASCGSTPAELVHSIVLQRLASEPSPVGGTAGLVKSA